MPTTVAQPDRNAFFALPTTNRWPWLLAVFLALAACSSPGGGDAFDELEGFAGPDDEVTVTLTVTFESSNLVSAGLPEADVEWIYFRTETPGGRRLHGMMPVRAGTAASGAGVPMRFRGRIAELDGKKAMAGFVQLPQPGSGHLEPQFDRGYIAPFLLTKLSTSWPAPGAMADDVMTFDEFVSYRAIGSSFGSDGGLADTTESVVAVGDDFVFLGLRDIEVSYDTVKVGTGQLSFAGRAVNEPIGTVALGQSQIAGLGSEIVSFGIQMGTSD